RVNVLSGVYATDQGIIEGKAREVLEVRSRLCPEVRIFADVLVKHALPLGEGDLVRAARDTVLRAGADAVIVTGTQTGSPPEVGEVKRLRKALPAPILVGSGLTPENVADYLPFVDGLIVGSTFKEGGDPRAPVSRPRVKAFLARLSRLRDRSRRSDRRPPPEGRVLP
ncbi:MAG: phosphorybosylanthranilate isomerase, partial [Deltaproteobacteria bacterium]